MTEKQKNTIEILEELWRFEKTEKYTETQIREALSTAIESVKHVTFVPIATITYDSDKLREIVNEAMENARPHGEWEEVYLTPEEKCFYGELWECSVCRVKDKKSNFCPKCGADMREGEENG